MTATDQRLTPLLRKLKREMMATRGYRPLGELVRGEEVIKAFAAGAGLDACALMREWTGFREAAKSAPKRTPPPSLDDDDEPVMPDRDEPDDDTEQTTKLCPVCKGLGRDKTGAQCARCNGTGRIAFEDQQDDDEEATSFYGHIEDEE